MYADPVLKIAKPHHAALCSRGASSDRHPVPADRWQPIAPLVDAWVASAGTHCECPPFVHPQKTKGRPRTHVVGCRRCWRSLSADRDLSPPHGLSLATRCLSELRESHPGVARLDVEKALRKALTASGFNTESVPSCLDLRDGARTRVMNGWFVWGWRDQRVGKLYVQKSGIAGGGGGAFAAVDVGAGESIAKYADDPVKAAALRDGSVEGGYVVRVGGPYIDARDVDGRLRLADGQLIDTHSLDWSRFSQRGVDWEGAAELSRFLQHRPDGADASAAVRGSDVVALRPIAANDEVFIDYGSRFWGTRSKLPDTCLVCLESEHFRSKLWPCEACAQYCIHRTCLQALLDTAKRARCECPLDLCTCDRLPSCPNCREPLPYQLTGRKQCATPGCTLPDFHDGECSERGRPGERPQLPLDSTSLYALRRVCR